MPTIYLNQRIRKDVVEALRRYEKKNKLTASISQTIKHLLDHARKNNQ